VTGDVVRVAATPAPSPAPVYGERNGGSTPRLKTLDATLQGAGFDARLSPDIMQAMLEKWVQLASLGAITCLMRGAIGEIVAAPGGADLSLKVLDESAAVATACGYKPSGKVLSRHAVAMTAPGSSLTSSMYRDLRKGAPVEADHILGDFIERGSAHGVATPLLKVTVLFSSEDRFGFQRAVESKEEFSHDGGSISAFIRTGSRSIKAEQRPDQIFAKAICADRFGRSCF
jgi:ketopantoate reductase